MRVSYHLDYCSLTYPAGALMPDDIGKDLIGDPDIGFKMVGGSLENPWLQSPMGVFYKHNNGSKERPISVQVQGAGCSHFEALLPLLMRDGAWITRLDFCFDVLMSNADWKRFVSKAFIYSLDREDGTKKSVIKFTILGDGLKSTIYVGSRSSGKYFRVYNKTTQNPLYKAYDADGLEIEVPDGYSLIRYEVELHPQDGHSGMSDLTDLSPILDNYLMLDPEFDLQHRLIKYWSKISDFVVLPDGFSDFEFVPARLQSQYVSANVSSDDVLSKNKNFVQLQKRIQIDKHAYPHTFDTKLWYMVTHYGAYVPWILRDPHLLRMCYFLCKEKFGYDQQFYVEPMEILNYDLDELEPPDEYIPEVWVQDSFDDNIFGKEDKY